MIIGYVGHDGREVCAGLQPSLRMMIHHTSHVFLVPETEDTRSSQLELCRRILRLYQEIVVLWILDHDTWYITYMYMYMWNIIHCVYIYVHVYMYVYIYDTPVCT